MATWVNREAWWAIDRKRVVHVARVLKQDLTAETMTVLLDNGATHEAPAYDVYLHQDSAYLAIDMERARRSNYGNY
jgi:hypothetical protein